jgi:hypothetical protein
MRMQAQDPNVDQSSRGFPVNGLSDWVPACRNCEPCQTKTTCAALFEARLDPVHPFCIAIDGEGPDDLTHMYGAANCTVVASVTRLPAEVCAIDRAIAV